MNRFSVFAAGTLLAMLAAAPVSAQQPGPANDPHHPATSGATEATPTPPSTPGSKGGDMPMMDMCRQMMGHMIAMPMMGSAAPSDPEERADMLQMHGEMMKAMGDIMMKHAQRMQGAPSK